MNQKRIFELFGLKGTIIILRYLNEHGAVQYKHFNEFVVTATLNDRLRQLLEFNLIQHNFTKKDLRKEWYELTEKGKKILQIVEDIIRLAED